MVARGAPARRRVGVDSVKPRLRARMVVLLVAFLSITAVRVQSAVAAARPDSALTNLFASLSGSGWVGADATYSVALPGGRDCWIFSDTITSMSATRLTFAHNSIVLTGRGRPRVIADPMPQPSPDAFYWAGAARVHSSQIWEIAQRIIQTGPGLWDFRFAGDYLAKINTSNWRLASITPLPGTTGEINWGVAMLDDGPFTYIYGTESQGLSSWMHVARVPTGRLDTPWSYYTSTGWAANAANDSLRLLPGVAPAFSVIDLGAGRGIRVISQQPMMGEAIYSWHAATPVGPLTNRQTIYTTGSYGARTYTYNTLAHPELTTHGQMLFSYNVNSYDMLTPATAALYHPRFFRAQSQPSKSSETHGSMTSSGRLTARPLVRPSNSRRDSLRGEAPRPNRASVPRLKLVDMWWWGRDNESCLHRRCCE